MNLPKLPSSKKARDARLPERMAFVERTLKLILLKALHKDLSGGMNEARLLTALGILEGYDDADDTQVDLFEDKI